MKKVYLITIGILIFLFTACRIGLDVKNQSWLDEEKTTDIFHGDAEGGYLGSLAARGVDELDRAEL